MSYKNKIRHVKEGYFVQNDAYNVERLMNLLEGVLNNSEVTVADCMTALCKKTTEVCFNANVYKDQFLDKLNIWWNDLQMMKNKDDKE